MNLRPFDIWCLNTFGFRYLPTIWLRAHARMRKRTAVLNPISQASREYDSMLVQAAEEIIAKLRNKMELPFFFNGCNYEGGDLEIYDYFLGKHKPKHIIEIGSGGSTQFAFWRTRGGVKITCIDPEPRTALPESRNLTHIAKRVQEVDTSVFRDLVEGDILFIDSSHSEEEADYHVRHILPVLPSGVLVHHHDVYYPYDIHCQWGEQKLLLQFYNANRSDWMVLCPAAFAYWYDHWLFRTRLLSSRLEPTNIPSSLWVQKK